MGLGKTLTVIATIIRTANEAKIFAEKKSKATESPKESNEPPVASKSTIVLCPSSRKLHCHDT